jgi:hypothetical protein
VGQRLAGHRSRDHDGIGRHLAEMLLAARAVDDVGRGRGRCPLNESFSDLHGSASPMADVQDNNRFTLDAVEY